MKIKRLSFLFVVSVCWADTGLNTLPRSVSDDVKSSYESAAKAIADRDPHFALALYEGVLLEGGVTICVDVTTVDDFNQEQAVAEALENWHRELADDFPIRLTSDPEFAKVTLRFVNYLPEGDESLGKIHLTRNYKWNSKKHSVTYSGHILIVRSSGGVRLDRDETRDVIMHEFGHMLGLADSEEAGTLMGELIRGKPAPKPSKSEVLDVVNLRRLTRTKIREAQGF